MNGCGYMYARAGKMKRCMNGQMDGSRMDESANEWVGRRTDE